MALLVIQIVMLALLLSALVAWLRLFAESRRARLTDPYVDPSCNHLREDETPHVTVCVPARNEEENIAECLRSILALDYPNFDVIVVDDRSTDRTAEILDTIAARDGRVKVLHNTELPDGWLGKCYALHVACQHTRSPWLLFIDADTRHHPQCLRACLRQVFDHDLDVMTVMCRLDARTFWEKTIMPVCGGMLLSRYSVHDTNRPASGTGFVNGQFILVKRETYDEIGGHEAVRRHILEDLAFAHNVKKAGKRIRIAWGRDVLSVRMFTTVEGMLDGWTRIFLGAFGAKPAFYLGEISRILIGVFLPIFALVLAGTLFATGRADPLTWLVAGAAITSAVFRFLAVRNVNIVGAIPGWYALFAPLAMIFLIRIFWRAMLASTGRRSVSLRGSEIALAEDSPFGEF